MRRYKLTQLGPEERARLCQRNSLQDDSILETCRKVFKDVQARGDRAVLKYTKQFDKVDLKSLAVGPEEW